MNKSNLLNKSILKILKEGKFTKLPSFDISVINRIVRNWSWRERFPIYEIIRYMQCNVRAETPYYFNKIRYHVMVCFQQTYNYFTEKFIKESGFENIINEQCKTDIIHKIHEHSNNDNIKFQGCIYSPLTDEMPSHIMFDEDYFVIVRMLQEQIKCELLSTE